ncbi:MAG: hypothetical protein AAF572_25180 [Cyanobacteria bacterium P01_B01_bin.77]
MKWRSLFSKFELLNVLTVFIRGSNMPTARTTIDLPHAPNSFSGKDIHVEFRANGVTDVRDSNNNRSLNQQKVPDHLILEVKDEDNEVIHEIVIYVDRS